MFFVLLAAWKSSLLDCLKDNLATISQRKNIEIIKEPVDLFQNYMSTNWLKLLSEDSSKTSICQAMIISILSEFYEERFSKIKMADTIIVTERYLSSAEVFVNSLREQELISEIEKKVLFKVLERFQIRLPSPNAIFFISRTIDWSMNFITARARPSEISFCTRSYIQSLSKYYNLYLDKFSKNNVEIVTCDNDDLFQVFLQ